MLTTYGSNYHEAVWSCIARLGNDTPARQPLHCQINISLGRLPDRTLKRTPGRPRRKWLDQIRSDNNLLPADLWRCAIRRGHSGGDAATMRHYSGWLHFACFAHTARTTIGSGCPKVM